jgi:hypothetical protein
MAKACNKQMHGLSSVSESVSVAWHIVVFRGWIAYKSVERNVKAKDRI